MTKRTVYSTLLILSLTNYKEKIMEIYNTSEARSKLYKLIDYVSDVHKPVYIKGKRNNVVIISEEDYRNMEETLYLLSIPNMHKSLIEGRAEPIAKCSDKLNW
ncbi:predicted antitoxin of toxin-antitoxin stability system [Rickettsia japonica]|uniref:Antitoxin n=5 Tax=spotted fever group TaxID=114277 RepID=G4KME0_RICJY|nr:antitoxin of toxin-antitoxin (TA) system stbD [Rickettsia japonica YH]BAW82511.1 predicted antitoxin of toxin-antitoxin stability system [Rickettsia japonica]